ncbi:unnamed protein product [Pylaiella littoralis]
MKTLAALLVWFILSSAADVPTLSDRSDELLECKLLGFGDMLACSTCTSFAEIVADRSLTNECLRCCQETKIPTKKYASARLVYDPRLLSTDRELRGFIEDRAADHPALELQPTLYAKTVLLMSEDGTGAENVDTVSIKRWKLDSIADYLHEHL